MRKYMKLGTRWSLVALSTLALVGLALPAAAVPSSLTVQGHLSNAAGQPANGDYALAVTLYDAPNAGNVIWSESYDVTVSSGAFDVALGENVANPLLATDFTDNAQVWMGITVLAGPGVDPGGDAELPRRPITTVGYAFAAQHSVTAESVTGGVACQNCVEAASLAFDPVTEAELSNALASLQIPSGSCPDGEAIIALGNDGSITCAPAGAGNIDQSDLPANGLNEVSNGLLSNQFVDKAESVDTPAAVGNGITSQIQFPDIGIAEKLTVSVDITTDTDLSGVTVKLIDPELVQYTLYNKDGNQGEFKATFPDPQPTQDGDLTTWIGKNPKGTWTMQIIDVNLNPTATVNGWSVNLQTLSNKKVAVNGNLIVDGQIKAANGTTIDGELNVTAGINFNDKAEIKGNIVFKDRVEFANSWCPDTPSGKKSLAVGGVCVPHVFGRNSMQNASLACTNLKADLCTDSQSWVLRSHGLLNANTQGSSYANWTNSYGGDDGNQFRHATGNTGDNHGPGNSYVAPCCYNSAPARDTDEKVGNVRVIHVHDSADTTFAWAARYCANLNADLCSKAQYQVLRDKGKISASMWANDHSDNDGGVCSSSIGNVADDPQPRDSHGFVCCSTSYKEPESIACPPGANETKGVCWVKTGQGSWTTAVQDCDNHNAQLCSISQNYVLRNSGIVSGSGNWTQSHSDNDAGHVNFSLGGGSDNPTNGQSYNYACCL